MNEYFTIIYFDGWNVGIKGDFYNTYLEFDSYEEARSVALLWDEWIVSPPETERKGEK